MKKLLSILTLLVVAVTGTWAQDPDYESSDWANADAITAALGTHGDVTATVVTGGGDGNVSGHWYRPLNSAISGAGGTYLQIASTRQILRVDVFFCPNGTNNTNLAWAAWGENVTPSAEVGSNYGQTDHYKASKAWDKATWQTINLSEKDVYTIRISRQCKKLTNGGSNISDFGDGQTVNLLGFRVYLKAAGPTITEQTIADANYVVGSPATALSVTATASAGTLTYQWYSNTVKSTTEGTPTEISGATNATYTPNTTSPGTTYYFCKVSDTNGFVYSDIAEIVVAAASAPTAVTVTPSATSVERGGDAITLTAEVTGGVPTPTLQWYSNTTASNESGAIIDGATEETYQPAIDVVGTFYYYVVATNASGSAKSAAQTITVVPKAPTMTPGGGFTTASKTVTIAKADGEDASAVIKYKEGDGAWQDYTIALNYTETTTVTAKVVQAGLESAEVSATYIKAIPHEWRTVSTAEVWDWSEATGADVNLTNETTPAKDSEDEIVAADFDGLVYTYNCGFPSNFDGIVMHKFQRPKNGTYYQGQTLKIKTSVPGTVTVTFANTGSKRPNRYLSVNGTIYGEGSGAEGSAAKKTVSVPVGAGNIVLTGIYEPDASNYTKQDGWQNYDNDNAGKPQYLNYYKVVFTPAVEVTSAGWATTTTPDYPVTFDTKAKVYVVASAEGSIKLTQIAEAPANTPVVVNAPTGSYTMTPKSEAAAIETNLLRSKTANNETAAVGDYALGTWIDGGNTVVGFGKLNAAGVANMTDDKAFIPASSLANAVDFLPFVIGDEESETTSINSIENGESRIENYDYFNLSGQRVGKDYKGIVIVNGKKFVRK